MSLKQLIESNTPINKIINSVKESSTFSKVKLTEEEIYACFAFVHSNKWGGSKPKIDKFIDILEVLGENKSNLLKCMDDFAEGITAEAPYSNKTNYGNSRTEKLIKGFEEIDFPLVDYNYDFIETLVLTVFK
jgi:hypothetical protein